MKSADLLTLYMPDFVEDIQDYCGIMGNLMESGKLKIAIDNGEKAEKGPFKGIGKIYDAIDVSNLDSLNNSVEST